MDADYKVKVSSQCNAHVGITVPNRNFVRNWSKKGQTIVIPYEILEEAIFDEGFKNMLDLGILHIDDLKAAQALGLEPEDVAEPVNYKVYSDAEINRLLNYATQVEFEKAFVKMPHEQQLQVCDIAVETKLRDGAKIAFIKKTVGIDINQRIAFDISMSEG